MTDRDTQHSEEFLVSIGEAARRLGVSVDTVRRWADEGKLSSKRTLGGQRRFREDDIVAVLRMPAAERTEAAS